MENFVWGNLLLHYLYLQLSTTYHVDLVCINNNSIHILLHILPLLPNHTPILSSLYSWCWLARVSRLYITMIMITLAHWLGVGNVFCHIISYDMYNAKCINQFRIEYVNPNSIHLEKV